MWLRVHGLSARARRNACGRRGGGHGGHYTARPAGPLVADLLDLVEDLAARGVGLRSLAEEINTTSATGRLVLHVFAALAEFERG